MSHSRIHHNRYKLNTYRQAGFTIVELMMATMVFSVILVVITVGVVHFTNAYYRGINNSTLQNTARGVVDAVAQTAQFGGGGFGQTPTTFCVGNQQYDYILGNELTTAASHGLYQTTYVVGSPCLAKHFGPGSKELLGPKMRVSKFSVTYQLASGLYTIKIRIIYGDDDLLCAPSLNGSPGGCNSHDATITSGQITASGNIGGLTCKSQSGSQFCSVAELTTTVQTRIGG